MSIIQRIINLIKKLITKRNPYIRTTLIPTRLGAKNKEAENANKLWSDEDTEEMLKMVRDNVPYKDIAYMFGRTKHSISARVYELKHKIGG